MKLWKISQTTNDGYDTYSDAIVAAESAREARLIHPREWQKLIWNEETESWWEFDETDITPSWDTEMANYGGWTDPINVTAELIGEAIPGTVQGIILSSFHAG